MSMNSLSLWLVSAVLAVVALPAMAASTLLNVSYDVSRELYKEVNTAFSQVHQHDTGDKLRINQSHGGASKQVLALTNGLAGDVVTMNQAADIEALARYGLVAADWREQFPYNATPYTSTTVFLVHKGNPKNIKDWDDLVREDVKVVLPNPKTSGSGRYAYLAAWGYALDKTQSEQSAIEFIGKLLSNVPVLDGGGRGATTTFTQRGMGDVLVSFENETLLIANELGNNDFEVIYPSISIDAAAPVAVVSKVAQKHDCEELARSYLQFLFSPQGQKIIAKHNFRPRDAAVLAENRDKFPELRLLSVENDLGGWPSVQAKHFERGALFDQIMEQRHGRY